MSINKVSEIRYENVAIIIPAYNEGVTINATIQSIPDHFINIICVDDGSSDDTAEHIKSTKAHLLRHPFNLGQGAALQTGIDFALEKSNIQYFVTYDADGQHRIEDVEAMLKFICENNDIDVVLGSRFMGKAINIRFLKKVILKLAILFSNASSGVKLTDTHNGLRVFNRKVAENLKLQLADFAHASEIINRIGEKKFNYKEYPVTIIYSEYSVRKGQSIINSINIAFDVLLTKVTGK